MKTFYVALILAGACSSAACAVSERVMPATMSDANVLAVLNTIDQSEIEAAQLAKRKAQSGEVRSYAGHIIDDHTAVMDKNRQLANRVNLRPEPSSLASRLMATHQETMERLRILSGDEFDRAYIGYQVAMHDEAVSLVEKTSRSADSPQLQRQLSQMVPDLRQHLDQAKRLQNQLGGKS